MLENVGNVSGETFRCGLRSCFSDLLGVSYRYGMLDHEMGLLQCKQPFEACVCILRTHMIPYVLCMEDVPTFNCPKNHPKM